MTTRALLAGVLVALVWPASIDLDACGDKFLRLGTSIRMKYYAPKYPATILVYRSAQSTDEQVRRFALMLTDANHVVVVVPHGEDVVRRVGSGAFDLVISGHVDARGVRERLRGIAGAPTVVPVVSGKVSRATKDDLVDEFTNVLVASDMTPPEAMRELDDVMKARRSITPPRSR